MMWFSSFKNRTRNSISSYKTTTYVVVPFKFWIILKFFVQAGVISLQKLLVLEKGVGQDTRSIYLIRSNPNEPEMDELQCQNPREKRVYIDMIGAAVALRNVFLTEIKVQSQRNFCFPLFSALDRLHWLNFSTISGWKSCAIFRIVCRRRKPNGPCRRSTSGSSTKSCSNFRNSSGLRTRTFSNRRRISIRSWKPSGGKAFLSPHMKIVSTAPWRRPSVPRLVMKTLRWRVHRSHLLPIRRPTPSSVDLGRQKTSNYILNLNLHWSRFNRFVFDISFLFQKDPTRLEWDR